MQEAEELKGTDVSMREVQGLVDGDVHMVYEGTEEHYGMDVDGPAPGRDCRFDEEKMHQPVVKPKLDGALSSGKNVLDTTP